MIKIGIVGYGNVGKGVEIAVSKISDMELVGIFTRRDPSEVKTVFSSTNVYHIDNAIDFVDKIDVMILCGGSATDILQQGPQIASMFNTIDIFDNHPKINDYFKCMQEVNRQNATTSLISCGWDPGLFSMIRLMNNSIFNNQKTYTFWGPGVSQGHSQAIRNIAGVKKAVQYTVPIQETLDKVKKGEDLILPPNLKHKRICYIVSEDGADRAQIVNQIKTMPNYFEGYDIEINFVDEETFDNEHTKMPHAGQILTSIKTGINEENKEFIFYSLNLDSNPEFTASVMVGFARAVYKLHDESKFGTFTIYDIPPAYLTTKSKEEMIREWL